MVDETALSSFRLLHDSSSSQSDTFDPRVFWIINALWITILLVVLIWCYSGGAERISDYITNRAEHPSDVIYIERLRERRARMEEEKKQTPEERRKTLEASFERNNVRMIVESGDFVEDVSSSECAAPTTQEEHGTATQEAAAQQEHDAAMNAIEIGEEFSGGIQRDHENVDHNTSSITVDQGLPVETDCSAPGYIMLRGKRMVPNCCAVCLGCYEQGESVVWSSNRECQHAFHEECVIEWFFKMQNGTPCPCCRQEFTDLDEHKPNTKERNAPMTFDIRVIRL